MTDFAQSNIQRKISTFSYLLCVVIVTRMAKSRDPDELKYYWLEWRKATGKRIRSLYEQYVELMDMTAVSNGN